MKSNQNKNNSLKYLMTEVMSERHTTKRFNTASNNAVSLDENAILSILESKVFTINERKALRVLFSKTKTKTLSENTINVLDENVKVISNSNEIEIRLREGFFGDIWDGLKGLGDKAKEAITGGWNKIKGIWAEFKELVQEVVNSAKNGLVKLCNMAKDVQISPEELMGKLKNKKITADPDLVKELKNLGTTGKWWTSSWYDKWVLNPTWETDVLSGKGTVQSEPDVAAADAEKGLESIPQLESLILKRNTLLANNQIVRALLERHINRKTIKESHAVEHLDDAIKNPALKKIIQYAIELIQWVFMPLAKLGQTVAKAAAPKILGLFSDATAKIGGPGAFAFELLGMLLGEFVEIYIKNRYKTIQLELVSSILFPGLGISAKFISNVHTVLFLWTCANVVINFVDIVEKQKTESYSPNGKFKIKEGNLIYIKK